MGKSVSNKTTLQEIEFTKNIPVPEQFQGREIPIYFRKSVGRIRIGVSLRISRGRVDLEHNGLFFYPLGLCNGLTGTAISVNAPFVLDQDRSRILENEWNDWLLDSAADLTIELLNGEWRDRFGSEAFLALRQLSTPSNPRFLERIENLLSNESCWPTRARQNGKSVLVSASKLTIPAQKEFDGFLTPDHYLDDSLYNTKFGEPIKEFAHKHGAMPFGLPSLVYLRCCTQHEDETLATKTFGDAAMHYTDYKTALGNIARQQEFGNALNAARSQLSNNHKIDLQNSPTTKVDPISWTVLEQC